MAAIEDIIAWCKHEQARLAQRLGELQAGRLRTCDKEAHERGWLEVDTTAQSIDRCREYLSELSAIIARYPEVIPPVIEPRPAPRVAPPAVPQPIPAERIPVHAGTAQHAGWVQGWGVVKGQPPWWQFAGIYETHAEADEAAAKAGEGYYARWGSYNERAQEFLSGPQ
jgi:hypothetical protein